MAPSKRKLTWDERYRNLKAFFDEKGQSRALQNTHIGRWLATQKKRKGSLTETQIDQLNEIGIEWESGSEKKERKWNEMFQLLREYRREHWHTRVRGYLRRKRTKASRWGTG